MTTGNETRVPEQRPMATWVSDLKEIHDGCGIELK